MKSLYPLVLLALNLAATQAGYSFTAYNEIGYHGKTFRCYAQATRSSICCDWIQTVMNDNLRSFQFSTPSNCGITLYKDWKRSGDILGSSYGSWSKDIVSKAGQQSSSAEIWCVHN